MDAVGFGTLGLVKYVVYDILIHEVQCTHQKIHDQFGKAILFNTVSDAVDPRMRKLSYQSRC